jgi:hypothetical protein
MTPQVTAELVKTRVDRLNAVREMGGRGHRDTAVAYLDRVVDPWRDLGGVLRAVHREPAGP